MRSTFTISSNTVPYVFAATAHSISRTNLYRKTVCKTFMQLIDGTKSLQYKIDLAAAGVINGHPSLDSAQGSVFRSSYKCSDAWDAESVPTLPYIVIHAWEVRVTWPPSPSFSPPAHRFIAILCCGTAPRYHLLLCSSLDIYSCITLSPCYLGSLLDPQSLWKLA